MAKAAIVRIIPNGRVIVQGEVSGPCHIPHGLRVAEGDVVDADPQTRVIVRNLSAEEAALDQVIIPDLGLSKADVGELMTANNDLCTSLRELLDVVPADSPIAQRAKLAIDTAIRLSGDEGRLNE